MYKVNLISSRIPTCLKTLLARWEVGICHGPNPACRAQVNGERSMPCGARKASCTSLRSGWLSLEHHDMVVPKRLNTESMVVEMCPSMALFQGLGVEVTLPFISCWSRYLHAAIMSRIAPGLFLAMVEAMCHSVPLSQDNQTADTLYPCGLCHYPSPLWTLLYLRTIALQAWAIPERAPGGQ